MCSLLVLIICGCTANDSKAYWIATIFIIIVYDSVGRIVRQGMARMACLFSVRFGLSAEITQVPGGAATAGQQAGVSFSIQHLYLLFLLV